MKWFYSIIALFLAPLLHADFIPLEDLKVQAENGDLNARVSLAHRRFNSLGDSRDPNLIYQAFSDGAEAGLPDAYAGLALCRSTGFGCRQSDHSAYLLARLSADLGSSKGYFALGRIAMTGQPVSAIRTRTQDYLRKAAQLGDHQAKFYLATYKFSDGGFSKITTDLQALEELAGQGHEEAAFALYSHYRNDDPQKSDKYLQLALKTEYPSAIIDKAFTARPGQDFTDRQNTREENEHALECYRKASRRGDRDALFQYAFGLSVHSELAREGEDWREIMAEAASLGDIRACDILAWSYYKPKDPREEPDYAKAEELLLRTLEEAKRGRYHTLGLIYLNGGYGVEKNPERTFKLLGRYADEIPYVYRILGKILTDWEPLQGKDVYKIRAYACYLRYQKMVPEPTEGLFEERTTPLGLSAAQIAEAQKLADDLYPTKPEHSLWAPDDGPYAPESLAQDAVAAYREKGNPAMRELLDERFTELHLARPRHPKLFPGNTRRFFRLFKEAQTGQGREDPAFAAALYQWLFDNTDQYPVSFSRYNIMNNLALALGQSGQRARAKVFLNQLAEILALAGFQTDLASISEKTPLDNFPGVQIPNYREVPLFGLDHASFLTVTAEQAIVEGRWKDSLAQAHAHSDAVRHKFASDSSIQPKASEWKNQMVASRNSQAEVLDLLQFHDLADEIHTLNSGDQFSQSYDGRSRLTSAVKLIRNQLRNSPPKTETRARLEDLIKQISSHKLLTTRNRLEARYALILTLFGLNQEDEAWTMLRQQRAENPDHLPFHLLWTERKIAAGEFDGLEDLLIAQLRSVRSQGEKVSEVRLHLLYVKLLSALGRLDEAIQLQREAIRLLESFDLYPWLPLARLDLADLYSRAGNLGQANAQRDLASGMLDSDRKLPKQIVEEAGKRLSTPFPDASEEAATDTTVELQPSQQLCVPLQDLPARGLFILKNPSRRNMSGQLQVTGPHRDFPDTLANQIIAVTAASDQPSQKTSLVNLALEPGEQVYIDLSTSTADFSNPGKLTLRWLPAEGPALESIWTYEVPQADELQSAVVDAGLYLNNPFFSVSIYHLLQDQNGFVDPVDLKVTASQRARIEVYDENNKLIFADHNGDGDLLDQGDLLVSDLNGDGNGDLQITRDGANSTRFLVQVTPAFPLLKEGMTVSYQTRSQEGWDETARDLILPRSK